MVTESRVNAASISTVTSMRAGFELCPQASRIMHKARGARRDRRARRCAALLLESVMASLPARLRSRSDAPFVPPERPDGGARGGHHHHSRTHQCPNPPPAAFRDVRGTPPCACPGGIAYHTRWPFHRYLRAPLPTP